MRKIVVLFIVNLWLLQINAQVETKYYPKGHALPHYMSKFSNINQIVCEMPKFNLEMLQKEDAETDKINSPYRFGKAFNTSYTLSDGSWTKTLDGRVWSMTFVSNGALSLNFVFDKFCLPKNAELYITNKDETVLYGPVTSLSIPKSGFFLTDIIPGSEATIYLYEPQNAYGQSSLIIKRVIHGYRGLICEENYGEQNASSDCHIDVACRENFDKESNAIGLVLMSNGDCLCSGSLMMTTDFSFKPYFLTAFHCADLSMDGSLSENEISNSEEWMFKFLFKKTTCDGSIVTGKTFNSATFRSGWHYSDFLLMEINQNLNNYELCWLGWDKRNNTPQQGVCIHHPCGDVMKISTDYDALIESSFNNSNNNGWRARWDEGITEGGSSGAPLFNQNKKVVGQVYGKLLNDYIEGETPCERKNTHFGKFYLSWTGGGTNNTRLSNWLDPINSGNDTICSYQRISISGSSSLCDTKNYSVENLPSGSNVSWNLTLNDPTAAQLIADSPALNQCQIVRDESHSLSFSGTLTATVIYQGDTITVLSKDLTGPSSLLLGAYLVSDVETGNDRAYPLSSTNYISLQPIRIYRVFSTYFAGKTITPILPPSSQGYIYRRINPNMIEVMLPQNGFLGLDISDSGCYSTYWAFVASSSAHYSMQIENSSYLLSVRLVENDEETQRSDQKGALTRRNDLAWTLEVYDISNSRKMSSAEVNGNSRTLDTSSWPKGIYIVRAIVDKEILSEKITIQ